MSFDEIYDDDDEDVHCCAQKSNCHSSELFSKGIAKLAQKSNTKLHPKEFKALLVTCVFTVNWYLDG